MIVNVIRRLVSSRVLGALSLVPVLLFGGASQASATDWGGDGSPTASCPNGYTVKTVPIVGSRGPLAGKTVGELQLRWSWTCHGQWSRVVLYGGMHANPVTVEQVVESEGRRAGATDSVRPGANGATAWTPFIRLRNSASAACAQVWASSDWGTRNFHTNGARVCA